MSPDLTLLGFSRGDDTDDFFAMFMLPVHVRNYQQDGGTCRVAPYEGDPPLLAGVLIDLIDVNEAAFVIEDQRGQFK